LRRFIVSLCACGVVLAVSCGGQPTGGTSTNNSGKPAGADATKVTNWTDPRPAAWSQKYPLLGPATIGDGSLKRVQDAGVLTICSETDIKPYNYIDLATSKSVGMEVEMANYVATLIGIKSVKYISTPYVSLIPSLQANKCDMVMDTLLIRSDRAAASGIKFTEPYIRFYDTLTVKKDSQITKFEDLKGKKVGVAAGSTDVVTAQALINAMGGGVTLRGFQANNECFLATSNGTVDACFSDQGVAKAALVQYTNLKTTGPAYPYTPTNPKEASLNPYIVGSAAAITHSADGDLNLAFSLGLDQMIASGEQKTLFQKFDQDWTTDQTIFVRTDA